METAADDSGIRKVLNSIVQTAWIMFCLFVLYLTLIPFLYLPYGNRPLAFPYFVIYMPGYSIEKVTSLQYYLSLSFMHIGYLMTIVFTYYIKRILQNCIAGRFYINDTVQHIKKVALSFACFILCVQSMENAIYWEENPFPDEIPVWLFCYVMPWIVISVITFIVISFFNLKKEQRLTV